MKNPQTTMKWQGIDTAPTDEREVLIYGPHGITIGKYDSSVAQWCDFEGEYKCFTNPTHWMPLPEKPQ